MPTAVSLRVCHITLNQNDLRPPSGAVAGGGAPVPAAASLRNAAPGRMSSSSRAGGSGRARAAVVGR
eukprot:329192-Prymnesium_polylepis.1